MVRNLVANRLATVRRQVVDLYELQTLGRLGKLSTHSLAFDEVPHLSNVEICHVAA